MNLHDMSYAELQAKARELGVLKVQGVSKVALIEEIERRQAPASSPTADDFSQVKPSEDSSPAPPAAAESSSASSDLLNHPKFDKFKAQEKIKHGDE